METPPLFGRSFSSFILSLSSPFFSSILVSSFFFSSSCAMAGATATVIAARSHVAVRTRIMRFIRITSFLSRSPANRLYLRDNPRKE
jgi:hypothetical protein